MTPTGGNLSQVQILACKDNYLLSGAIKVQIQEVDPNDPTKPTGVVLAESSSFDCTLLMDNQNFNQYSISMPFTIQSMTTYAVVFVEDPLNPLVINNNPLSPGIYISRTVGDVADGYLCRYRDSGTEMVWQTIFQNDLQVKVFAFVESAVA